MYKLISVLEVIVPIFTAIFLGVLARRRNLLSPEQTSGLQQFVMKFGLPCVLFNSCLSSSFGAESVSTMALLLPLLLLSSLWAFRVRKQAFPYHNLPMLFSAQESGMLGIPLFMTLFGTDQAFRMGILDMTQSLIAIPVISILAASPSENPTPAGIIKEVFKSPLLLLSLLGLGLNLTGIADVLDQIGVGPVITETTGFIAQPVSASMLFSVGYNFSLGEGSRRQIFRISAIHFSFFAAVCVIIQAALFLVSSVDASTRWAILLYCMLPASFLSPSLGRTEEDATVSSGVCSILTVACLIVFCLMTIIVA